MLRNIIRSPLTLTLVAAAVAASTSLAWAQEKPDEAAASREQTQQEKSQPQQEQSQQQSEQQNSDEAEQQAEQQEQRQLQTFELKHRSPSEIERLLTIRTQTAQHTSTGKGSLTPNAIQRRTSFYRGPTDGAALAADDERKLLFARGTPEQIEQIKTLVTAVDVAEGEFKTQTLGETRLIPIPKEQASHVSRILGQLQLPHNTMSLDQGGLLIVCEAGSEEQQAEAEQVEQVISKITEAQKTAEETAKQEAAKAEQKQAEQQQAEQQQAEQQKAEKPDQKEQKPAADSKKQ